MKRVLNSSPVLVLTTFPSEGDAEGLARTLVAERLAACVNVLPPMRSIYRWRSNIEETSERQLVIKTVSAAVDLLKARLIALHPYDLPEVLVVRIEEGSEAYLKWLQDSVT